MLKLLFPIEEENAERLICVLGEPDGVEAIALGGSRAGGEYDALSDYDVYVYCSERPSDGARPDVVTDELFKIIEQLS